MSEDENDDGEWSGSKDSEDDEEQVEDGEQMLKKDDES